MTRIFRYILKNDTGMAPCIDQGLVSLAVCKPKIRGSAKPGDWVVGLCPKSFAPGKVAWAGRVEAVPAIEDYEARHRDRSDAIYRLEGGAWRRLRPEFHDSEKQIRKDLSAPVMVFDKAATWYFGDTPRMLPEELQHLLFSGQGHRVNGVRDGDPKRLQAWLDGIGQPGLYGKPPHLPILSAEARLTA